jgi:hypothetical protein
MNPEKELNMKSIKSAAKLAVPKPVQKTPRKLTIAEIPAPAASVAAAPPVAAPAPVAPPTPKPVTASPAPAAPAANGTVTTIDVKADVGFGNALYLRGEGSGLNWDQGVPLTCLDSATWRWSGEIKAPVTFKVLINDTVWATGNDLTVAPGQKIEIVPTFA